MYKIASWIVFLIFLACFMIVPYMVGLVCRVYIPGWTTPDTVVTWLFGLVVLSAVIIVGSGVYWVTCAMKVLIVDGVEKELERVHKEYRWFVDEF